MREEKRSDGIAADHLFLAGLLAAIIQADIDQQSFSYYGDAVLRKLCIMVLVKAQEHSQGKTGKSPVWTALNRFLTIQEGGHCKYGQRSVVSNWPAVINTPEHNHHLWWKGLLYPVQLASEFVQNPQPTCPGPLNKAEGKVVSLSCWCSQGCRNSSEVSSTCIAVDFAATLICNCTGRFQLTSSASQLWPLQNSRACLWRHMHRIALL